MQDIPPILTLAGVILVIGVALAALLWVTRHDADPDDNDRLSW